MTKRETAFALLRTGATLQAIVEATGWHKGTANNWLSEVRRSHGLDVVRHRCVGPGVIGARGSFTIYTLQGEKE
jgi:hypothetical protein